MKWIPTSERLPSERGEYLVTVDFDGDTYVECFHYGKPMMANREVKGECFYDSDDEWGDVVYDKEVIAWMPLPKPYRKTEPQTEVKVEPTWVGVTYGRFEDEPQTETEIAKAIVHKMIDDAVIAEDAYPDLRQRMHDAVDECEPQTEVETMSCAECKHRPIGAEICEEACHYEPQTDWHYDEQDATWYPYKHEDEPQQKSCATCKHALGNWDGESNNCGRCCGADRRFYEPKTEPQTLDDIGRQIQDAYDKGIISDADATQAWYEAVNKTEPQTESLEQFRVGLEYHTDTTHFGKTKGESVTTNKIEDEPQTDCHRCIHFTTDNCRECFNKELFIDSGYITKLNEPDTDCTWK